MSDLFDAVKGGQDFLTKIISYVPGFKGYVERSQRRSADKLLRDQVALKYSELAKSVSELMKEVGQSNQIEFIDDLDSIRLKLTTFADRIKNASYGYSGFFDSVKINEKELEKIYAFDNAFFEVAEQITSGFENIEAAIGTEGLKSAIRAVNKLALEANQAFDRRYQILTAGEGEIQPPSP